MTIDRNDSDAHGRAGFRQVVGWAAQGNGTTGGGSGRLFIVDTVAQLREVLRSMGDAPKILMVRGTIDVSEGRPYANRADQSARGTVRLTSNTTLVGGGPNAKIIEGALFVQDVHNVIVHNLFIENPVDVDPQFEDGDGWNAEWDGLSIVGSHHVWVDQVTFSDGRFTIDQYKEVNGWKFVQHDGALDIKRGADYVTVSHCRFELHDKTILIGHSDSNGPQDRGTLRVTFLNNHFTRVMQRTPRVRFGNVHLFNNVFEHDRNDGIYPYQYSYGIGVESTTRSERNAFLVGGLSTPCSVTRAYGGSLMRDTGSTLNHAAVDLNSCGFNPHIGTPPPYPYVAREMSPAVVEQIRREAGVGVVRIPLPRD
ncbi:hypothetical protein V4F39_18525 [Aquincola sp. MAHUQ-54]|uniref:Pectate lyase domain-containing protein n=1 Tax=Aquincola agrisoli TaxID=3119538 RepID=A0AAW9QKL7_9BURK